MSWRSNPAGIGGRNSTVIRPDFMREASRGQKRPELSAMGMMGNCNSRYKAATPDL